MILEIARIIANLTDRYDPISEDSVRGFAFHERFASIDYMNYLKVWVAEGLCHLRSYVNAFLAMESGWFSWKEYVPMTSMAWHSQMNADMISEEVAARASFISALAAHYQKLYDDLYESLF